LNKQLFFCKAVGGIFLYGASNNLKSHLQTQLSLYADSCILFSLLINFPEELDSR